MKIFIGADHRGFKLKEFCKAELGDDYDVVDCGAKELDKNDDYVEFATNVANSVVSCQLSVVSCKGIVICGSGVGVCMMANKIKGIRCGLGINAEQVKVARKDDDINVLALAADFVNAEQAKGMAKVFLETDFSGEERHKRRLEKISKLEG